ncbi:MAG: 4-hydroxy-tetrahydrodipicolinate synthase [Clostridiales bacterium]|jgi:4-hydroxy-tetrahydrodipicolinate synthase|nr:4-hydroxy-tetrahydrodipicolinate synthase [Clostridiales bacterium]
MTQFTGLGVAMITPFTQQDTVNFDAAERIIEHLITNGTGAIVVLGTTGEPPTMNECEKTDMLKFTVDRVKGRVPVIAGCGCNCTTDTVQTARHYEKLGADGLLVVTPYYNKCTQEGLVAHYRAISDAVGVPIMAYNVPGRTNVNILPKTALRLAELKNVRALKEASGNIDQLQEVLHLAGDRMDIYLGDDNLIFPGMCLGAKGVVSVVGNAVPQLISRLTGHLLKGEYEQARALNFSLLRIYKALFLEVNPIPVKWAMNYLGFEAGTPRLPLTALSEPYRAEVAAALDELGSI